MAIAFVILVESVVLVSVVLVSVVLFVECTHNLGVTWYLTYLSGSFFNPRQALKPFVDENPQQNRSRNLQMGYWIFLAGPFVGQYQNFFLPINHRPESCVYSSTLIAYLAHVFAMTQPRWSSSFLLVMTPTKTRLGRVASTSVFLLMRFWLSIHSSSSWRSGGSPNKSLSTATRSESILEPKNKHYVSSTEVDRNIWKEK